MKNKILPAIAVISVLMIVAFFYQSAAFSSRTGEDTPLYSIRRHDPYGTAALHDLLVDRGVPVRTLELPVLEDDDHGVLIQVLSSSDSPQLDSHLRTRSLIDWMSRGNTVIQLTRSSNDLLDSLKIKPTTQPSTSEMKTLREFETNGGAPEATPASTETAETIVAGKPLLMLWSPMVFGEAPSSTWKAIGRISSGKHHIVAGEMTIGKGRLVFVGAPTPAINGTIGSKANLDFMLALIGTNPVIFDEWSHGISHDRTVVSFLRDVGLLPMLLQVALVAVLYVWSTSGHAAPIDAGERPNRSSIEQIETLGYLYGRSLGPAVTFERVEREVQRRMAGVLNCQPKDLATRLQSLKPELRGKIERLFSQMNDLRNLRSVVCPNCGYDLAFNQSGRCPECGSALSIDTSRKLQQLQSGETAMNRMKSPPSKAGHRRPNRLNLSLANLLTLSHQISQEVMRERRSAR